MAVSVAQAIATQSGASAVTSISVTLTTTPTVGNLLWAAVAWRGTATLTVPSGWTSQAGPVNVGTTETLQVLTRVVQSGDGTAYSFTISAANQMSLGVREISGQAASGYVNQIATQGNSSANVLTTASITPTVANCLIIADFAYAGGDPTTAKSGWTEDYAAQNATENNSQSAEGQNIAQTTAAAISGSCTLGGGHAHTSCACITAIAPATNTSFSRTVSSSIAHTASVARAQTLGRAVSSSIAPAAAAQRSQTVTRTQAGSVSHTAARAATVDHPRAASTTVAATATVQRSQTLTRTQASTLAPSAALTRVQASLRGLTNAVTQTAALTRTQASLRSLTALVAHTAALTRRQASLRSLTSAVGHTAALTRAQAITRTLTSADSHNAVLTRAQQVVRVLASTVPHLAAVTGAKGVSGNSRSLTSTVTHVASVVRAQAVVRGSAATVTHVATLKRAQTLVRAPLSGIALSAQLGRVQSAVRSVAATVVPSAVVSRALHAARAVTTSTPVSALVARGVQSVRGLASTTGPLAGVTWTSSSLPTVFRATLRLVQRLWQFVMPARQYALAVAATRTFRFIVTATPGGAQMFAVPTDTTKALFIGKHEQRQAFQLDVTNGLNGEAFASVNPIQAFVLQVRAAQTPIDVSAQKLISYGVIGNVISFVIGDGNQLPGYTYIFGVYVTTATGRVFEAYASIPCPPDPGL